MIGSGRISPYFRSGGGSSPIGDLFTESFNPQVGTYVNVGSATNSVTSGNMDIAGGNGTFNNVVQLQDVVWNGNNWYLEYEYVVTNTNNGVFSTAIGLVSINTTQLQSVAFGIYYFDGANNGLLYIFNDSSLNSGNAARKFTQNITVTAGDRLRIRGEFIESVLTVYVTNLTTSATTSDSLSYLYTVAGASNSYEIKPNTGKIFMLAPQNTVNVKSINFGSQYLVGVDRLFHGDSMSSGYYQESETERYENVYSTSANKTIAIFAGAGDKTLEVSNATALTFYTQLRPKKVLYFAGSNDVVAGTATGTIITRINAAKTAYEAVGSTFIVAVPIPRNGVSVTALRTAILAEGYTDVIDWYSLMEDPGNPGDLEPTYTDDNIHPNALGASVMAAYLISEGF